MTANRQVGESLAQSPRAARSRGSSVLTRRKFGWYSDSSLTVDDEEPRPKQLMTADGRWEDPKEEQPTSPHTAKRRREEERGASLAEAENSPQLQTTDHRDEEPVTKRAKVASRSGSKEAEGQGDDEVLARNAHPDDAGQDKCHDRHHSRSRNKKPSPMPTGSRRDNYSDREEGEYKEHKEHRDREGRRERCEAGLSNDRRHSFAAEPNTRDAPSRRKASISQEERKRGQRLFGGLLSTISQPAKRSAQQEHRRPAEELRQRQQQQQQQSEKRETKEDKQRKAERIAKLAMARKIEQVKIDEKVMTVRHSNLLALARNLQTKSEPRLYYRPWELKKKQEQIIEDQILAAKEIIERETREFARQKQERLVALGVAVSAPQQKPEPTTSAAKTDVDDRKPEGQDRDPSPSLAPPLSPLRVHTEGEKNNLAGESELPEHHDDQRHRHDHDDRDRDIMVETEEDTVIY